MRLDLRSIREILGIVGEAVIEVGRDIAGGVVAFLQGDGEPMVDHGPDDETTVA